MTDIANIRECKIHKKILKKTKNNNIQKWQRVRVRVQSGMVHTPYQKRLPYRVTFLVWCMDSSTLGNLLGNLLVEQMTEVFTFCKKNEKNILFLFLFHLFTLTNFYFICHPPTITSFLFLNPSLGFKFSRSYWYVMRDVVAIKFGVVVVERLTSSL